MSWFHSKTSYHLFQKAATLYSSLPYQFSVSQMEKQAVRYGRRTADKIRSSSAIQQIQQSSWSQRLLMVYGLSIPINTLRWTWQDAQAMLPHHEELCGPRWATQEGQEHRSMCRGFSKDLFTNYVIKSSWYYFWAAVTYPAYGIQKEMARYLQKKSPELA